MEKIAEFKIRKYGLRGFQISIPRIWVNDNELNDGDKIPVFREGETLIIKSKDEVHKFVKYDGKKRS
jgi:hypothetical protein